MNYEYQMNEMRKKIEKSMKLINTMKWKKIAWWRVTYLWMTYVVPHLRYGALIYTPNAKEIKEGKVKGAAYKFRKIFHATVKNIYNLPKQTSANFLEKVLGN